MTVDLPILISGLSLIVAIIVAASNIRSRNAEDNRESASQITTLIVKLENISDGINEIKTEMRTMKNDVQDLRDRVVRVEQKCDNAHHRLDMLEGSAVKE